MTPSSRWQWYGHADETLAPDWNMQWVSGPSALSGANGISAGIDGRVYVAQAMGAQISAIDPDSGAQTLIVPQGGGMQGCDDCAMLADGALVTTEPGANAVGVVGADGRHRHLPFELPAVNGIALDRRRQRLFVDEYREGGRLLELDPSGKSPPRVLLEDLDYPNAFSMAPDGSLYFPQVRPGEIWRYGFDSATAKPMFTGLEFPTAVKARPDGRLVAVEAGSGKVTELDPRTGARRLLAQVDPGIDNLVVTDDDRIIISHYLHGAITEIASDRHTQLSPPGWVGPYDVAVRADGALLVADGLSVAVVSGGTIKRPIYYGGGRRVLPISIACAGPDTFVLDIYGDLLRYRDLAAPPEILARSAHHYSRLFPWDHGSVGVVDNAGDCLLRIDSRGEITPLHHVERPIAACRDGRGNLYVVHDDGRRVAMIEATGGMRFVAGFTAAQGIACHDDALLVCDTGARSIVSISVANGARREILRNSPIGAAGSYQPMGGFAALCTADEGFYVGCNGDGSIRLLHRRA